MTDAEVQLQISLMSESFRHRKPPQKEGRGGGEKENIVGCRLLGEKPGEGRQGDGDLVIGHLSRAGGVHEN